VPAIRALHARGEALKQSELERARRMLARGDDPQAVLEALAGGLTRKFLHGPTLLLQRPGPGQQQIAPLIDQLLPDDKP
jgi:glutamyl-tRNA reductase